MIGDNRKKLGWTFPSLLTLSMTINSTVGQTMKTDFMESIPLMSSSVFKPEEELGSKFSMEWNPNLQSSQLLLDSWHPQNFETTLDSKQKENFDCASMNSLLDEIQSLKLIVKEKSLFSSPSFERFLPRLKTVNGNCFSKSYANDTTAASSDLRPQLEEDQSRFDFAKGFLQFLEPPCSSYRLLGNLCLYSWPNYLWKLNEKFTNIKSSFKQIDSSSPVLPLSRRISPSDDNQTILSLKQTIQQKCYKPYETKLCLKACALKATNFNPYQGCYQETLNHKLCKLVFEIRKVLIINQSQLITKMDQMDLLDDGEVVDMEGAMFDLLGQVALAHANELPADVQEMEDEEEFDIEEDDEIYGDELDYDSDSFHGSYGSPRDLAQSPLPTRSLSPNPNRLIEAARAREFQQFSDRMMLDFRIQSNLDSFQTFDDLECNAEEDQDDQAVPASQ